MKKTLACIVLITLLFSALYAGGKKDEVDYTNPVSVQDKILDLTERNFKANRDEISVLSSYLSPTEKEIVYSLMEIDPEGYGARNFFLGWGEGSSSMGDSTGGTLMWITDTLCLAAIITPAVPLAIDSINEKHLTVTDEWKTKWMYPFAITGLSVGLLSRCISIALPGAFAKKRNKEYRQALGLPEGYVFAVVPQFDPVNLSAGVKVCISF